MYTKDKNIRVTLRLNQQQFDFVKANADCLGVSPSEFLRIVVNAAMSTGQTIKSKMEGVGRENDKADFNNIV